MAKRRRVKRDTSTIQDVRDRLAAYKKVLDPQRVYVGIDPGIDGAFAVLWPNNTIFILDMPTKLANPGGTRRRKVSKTKQKIGGPKTCTIKDNRREYRENLILKFLRSFRKLPDHIEVRFLIEKQQARQTDGAYNGYRVGLGMGYLLMAITAVGLKGRCELVPPAEWKKDLKLVADNSKELKEKSIKLALKLWPGIPLTKAKHHDRAEAALLAGYCRRRHEVGR